MDGVTDEGSRCLAAPEPMSQMDAALDAVRQIGLNQLEEVRREWVDDAARGEMLRKRLDMLKHEKSNSIKTGSRLFCVCCPFALLYLVTRKNCPGNRRGSHHSAPGRPAAVLGSDKLGIPL